MTVYRRTGKTNSVLTWIRLRLPMKCKFSVNVRVGLGFTERFKLDRDFLMRLIIVLGFIVLIFIEAYVFNFHVIIAIY